MGHKGVNSAEESKAGLCGSKVHEQIRSPPSSSPELLLVVPAALPSGKTNILRMA